MQKIAGYFSWIIILLYFVLGAWVLVSDRFDYLSKELKYIFAAFLFLYGGFRMARLWSKYRAGKGE
jgi:positive regulator of sigma E activity